MSFVREDKECPKLYIAQPDFSKPIRRMQSTYQSNQAKSADTKQGVLSENSQTKKVKDMTLEEKVKYFASKPSHLPKVRCQIKTDKRNYHGFIQEYQNEMVTIRLSSKVTPITVPFEQITAIDIIGF